MNTSLNKKIISMIAVMFLCVGFTAQTLAHKSGKQASTNLECNRLSGPVKKRACNRCINKKNGHHYHASSALGKRCIKLSSSKHRGKKIVRKFRKVSPQRGRLVKKKFGFKARGGAAATCCTHWNTSTGGTGCATYPDSCPDNTFTVSCGKTGCW